MDKNKLESLLIDYIDGKLNTIDRQHVEQELTTNPDAYALYEQLREVLEVMDRSESLVPSDKMKTTFAQRLEEEIDSSRGTIRGKTVSLNPWWYRVAAAVAFVAVGGWVGYFISQQRQQSAEVAALKKQMEETQQFIVSKLDDVHSPGNRILGVHAAYEIKDPGHDIVDALIKVMNDDPNSNVRLAAVEALARFHNEPKVRNELIKGLSTQTDPVVQMALIQLMVQMKEKAAVKPLQKLTEDESVLPAVKDEAYAGVVRLSES